MPIFPFQCRSCGAEFEVTRKATAAGDAAPCPACGGATKRVFTAVGRAGASAKGGDGGGSGWSHAGHSHAAGSDAHSHGPVNPSAR